MWVSRRFAVPNDGWSGRPRRLDLAGVDRGHAITRNPIHLGMLLVLIAGAPVSQFSFWALLAPLSSALISPGFKLFRKKSPVKRYLV